MDKNIQTAYTHPSLLGTTQKLQVYVKHDRLESNSCNQSVRAKSSSHLCCSVHLLILKTFPNDYKAEGLHLPCWLRVDAWILLNNLTLITTKKKNKERHFLLPLCRYQELSYEIHIQIFAGCQKCPSPPHHNDHISSFTFVRWLSTAENQVTV